MDQFDLLLSIIGAVIVLIFKARNNKKLFKQMILDIFSNHSDLITRMDALETSLATHMVTVKERILVLETKLSGDKKV